MKYYYYYHQSSHHDEMIGEMMMITVSFVRSVSCSLYVPMYCDSSVITKLVLAASKYHHHLDLLFNSLSYWFILVVENNSRYSVIKNKK